MRPGVFYRDLRDGGYLRDWMFWLAALMVAMLAPTVRVAGKVATNDARKSPAISCSAGLKVLAELGQSPFPGGNRLNPSLARGIAWMDGRKEIAVGAFSGLMVWKLAAGSFNNPSILPYNRMGVSWFRQMLPDALIEQGNSIAVAIFVAGAHGASPRLVMNWYSRKSLRFLRCSEISLRGVRNTGVQVIAPRNGSWFATLSYEAVPWSTIHLWNSLDGRAIPMRFPPLWQVHNWMFCGSAGRNLGWVSSGHHVRLANFLTTEPSHLIVNQIRLVSSALRKGTMSPDRKHFLLLACTNPFQPAEIKVILAPRSGSGVEKVIQCKDQGILTAAPVFSSNGKLAAFSIVSPHLAGGGASAEVFIISVRQFHILYQARIPAIIPTDLSFSPGGRRLAVEGRQNIILLGISVRRPRSLWKRLPWASPQWITLPPASVPLSIDMKVPPVEMPSVGAKTQKGDHH